MDGQNPGDLAIPDELDSTERQLNPFPWYKKMRESTPVRYDETRDRWDIFRYDDVKRVLSEYETFSSMGASDIDPAGNLGTTMVDVDPPEHGRLRDAFDDYFIPGTLRNLSPSIRSIVDDQLDKALSDGSDVEVISELTSPITVLSVATVLGVPSEQWDMITQVFTTQNTDESGMGDVQQILNDLHEYFGNLIDERQQNPQNDLITVIADTESSETKLTRAEQTSFCSLLFLAGHSATNAVGHAFRTFAEEGLYTEIRDGDIDVGLAFDEVLRYRGPVASVSGRRTTKEVELNGTIIPADEQITAWIGSANRDPEVFDNPDQFQPERKPNRHIAFGHGPHYCLGAPLARIVANVVFNAVTERVKEIELAADSVEPQRDLVANGLTRLPMQFRT